MKGSSGDRALRASMQRAPGGLQEWVASFGGVSDPVGDARLLEAAKNALGAALRLPPEAREAAWALLAADALLTWGVEAAASAPDPEAAMARVLERVLTVAEDSVV
jgi:hypothetical protein